MERDKRIGLNLASMLPWSAIPGIGLPLAALITDEAGTEETEYSFWQVLLLRGVTVRGLEATEIPVRFAEPAWNPTTWRRHFLGKLGAEGMHTKLQDPLFFPAPWKCELLFRQILEQTGAQPIYHHITALREGGLVEVHPELRMTPERLANTASRMGAERPYVLDTRHLRRPLREGGESLLRPWEKALEMLIPYTALVHFQPLDGEEMRRSLNGEITELVQILMYLKGNYDGPFVIELSPADMGLAYFANPRRMIDILRDVRELIEENL